MKNPIFDKARGAVSPDVVATFFDVSGGEIRTEKKGREYYILNPLRFDKSVGSFSINLDMGFYTDHATSEGGDFIDLLTTAKNVSKTEAAEMIANAKGEIVEDFNTSIPPKKDNELIIPASWPIPNDATQKLKNTIEQDWAVKAWGTAKKVYKYKSPLGEWMFSVVRFEVQKDNGKIKKSTIPFYWTGNFWKAKKPDDLMPWFPYKGETVKPGKPVLIVEGEKCANVEVEGYSVISWMGGTGRVSDTNWEVLKDHDAPIYIIPDADSQREKLPNKEVGDFLPQHKQPGMKAAMVIKERLPNAIILPVYQEWPIETDPDGYDIADYVEAGGDPVELINRLLTYVDKVGISDGALQDEPPLLDPPEIATYEDDQEPPQIDPILHEIQKTPVDPYLVYRAHIEHHFSGDCLEQNGGMYWEYAEDKHYWSQQEKENIMCNLQRWLEQTGLHKKISGKAEPTAFFNKIGSYIRTHSNGMIKENPFTESAVTPYVHVGNGAIYINKDDIRFHSREKEGEGFFKKLFPTHCLDFDFDDKYMGDIDPEKEFPAFWHFIKGLVPAEEIEKQDEEWGKRYLYEECLTYVCQILAYTLTPEKPNEYFFGITGDQATGKSFFMKIVKSFIGAQFCTEMAITAIEKDAHATAGLWGKKVFIEPDLKARAPLPDNFLKSYAGQQELTVRPLYSSPISGVKMSLAIFILSNYDFVVKGSEGVERRMIYLPYKNRIENPDRTLLDKIIGKHHKGDESGYMSGEIFDERPAILGMALQSWKKFIDENSQFRVPQWAQNAKDQWVENNSSVASWVRDLMENEKTSRRETRAVMYGLYKEWCNNEDRKHLGKKNFFEEMRRVRGVKEVTTAGIDMFNIESRYKGVNGDGDGIDFESKIKKNNDWV